MNRGFLFLAVLLCGQACAMGLELKQAGVINSPALVAGKPFAVGRAGESTWLDG
jgi:hypothetical protein